jgi:hypothetical protein
MQKTPKIVNPWKMTLAEAGEVLHEALKRYHEAAATSSEELAGFTKAEAEEADRLRFEYEHIADQLRARPDFFHQLRMFMVDIHGKIDYPNKADYEEKMSTIFESDTEHDFHNNIKSLQNGTGPLVQDIREFVTESGYFIHDSGGGLHGWHLGCYCTLPEALNLTQLLRDRFTTSIDAGLIYLELHDWSRSVKSPYDEEETDY